MDLEFPEFTAKREGIRWDGPPRRRARTVDPAPDGAGDGQWRYGLRNEDGELLTSWSSWHVEPFNTREEALDNQEWFGGVLVRAWVPKLTWEEAPS